MQSIFDTIRNGNARERLAVISDILSILGVSLAVTLGPLLTLPEGSDVGVILDYIQLGAAFLIGTIIMTIVAIMLHELVGKTLHSDTLKRFLLSSVIWLLWLTGLVALLHICRAFLPSMK